MNFQEAEAQFRWLEGQRAAGNLNEQAYRDGLSQLRVTDAAGRLWMIQERSGQWHVHDGQRWIPATPPIQPPPPPPPQPSYSTASRSAAPLTDAARQPAPAQSEGCSCAKFALFFVIWLVIWVIIAAVVYFFFAREEPMVLLGVAAAALLSLVLMLFSLAGHWKGQIIELKTERVQVQSGEDDWDWEDQTFAYIRQPNGRIRRMRAMNGWQVGDWLEKRRGEAHIRVTH